MDYLTIYRFPHRNTRPTLIFDIFYRLVLCHGLEANRSGESNPSLVERLILADDFPFIQSKGFRLLLYS